MTTLHTFLDYLYDIHILNRNGLGIMQEFLRVCERNNGLEDQIVCKLANYIKSMSASDCYDLSSRLLQNYKYQKEQQNNTISIQSNTLPINYATQLSTQARRISEHIHSDLNSQQAKQNVIAKQVQVQSQKLQDLRRRIQMNDKLKVLSNIVSKQQQRIAFECIKQHSQLNAKHKRQLSPSQTVKMSNHIKQQLNSIFDLEEQKRDLIKNNSIQKLKDYKSLARNQSNEDFNSIGNLKQKYTSQNNLLKQGSPNQIKRNRSNFSSISSTNLSIAGQQSSRNNVYSSNISSPSSQINKMNNSNMQINNPIKNLKESLNKEITESNQHLKLSSRDIRLTHLNLRDSFKLIHEHLEADLITNQEAIQMIDSIREKQYDQICTFKPQINKENQYYEKIKSRDISNAFERLYKDGVEHKVNKSQILSHIKGCLEMKDCTFHPNIQKSTPKSRNVRFAGSLQKFATFSKDNQNESFL